MNTIDKLTIEQEFFSGISDHWQQRARKLQARRWKALERKIVQSKE